MGKMTEKQDKLLQLAVKEALREADLDTVSAKRVLINREEVKRGIVDIILDNAKFDKRFASLCGFFFQIPHDYDPHKELSVLRELISYENTFSEFNITDDNFANVTSKLLPGETYFVRIFEVISDKVTATDCLSFLSNEGAILTGAQGLSLVWRLGQEKFPFFTKVFSFDKRTSLWKDNKGWMLPHICKNEHWSAGLSYFEKIAHPKERKCIVCFFQK